MARRAIASAQEVRARGAVKFTFEQEGIEREGFVIFFEGAFFAYENACRHIPIPIDYGDGDFFTRDGTGIICRNHGAIYEPATGFCVAGPCEGASLKKLRIFEGEGMLWMDQD